MFAADYDLEQKRRLTELQLKEHMLQQQRAMLEATNAATTASMEVGYNVVLNDCCYMIYMMYSEHIY